MFLKNKGFFDSPMPTASADTPVEAVEALPKLEGGERSLLEADRRVQDAELEGKIQRLKELCGEAGRKDLLQQLSNLEQHLSSSRFTVAVVGEFNRGKSTLVNRLIGLDIIPTSDIPTTSVPIRVVGSKQEGLLAKPGGTRKLPLAEKSWDVLLPQGENRPGEVVLYRNCPLLMEYDLEIIDTPGVNSQIKGDLTMAEWALENCDCAILPIAAITPLSQSEKMFLEERLLMKKIPRIMVILTKLDLVEEKYRMSVIQSVQSKLHSINPDIPLYLSSKGMAPDWEERSGTQAIQQQLCIWLEESSHVLLKKQRALRELKGIAEDLAAVYTCQLEILSEKKEKRKIAAEQKKQSLRRSSEIAWDSLQIDLLNRCNENFEWIRNMTEERQQDVVEKLLLELSHVNSPKDWWENDYPYRMKMEMIALGNALEGNLQNFYTRDINWLNHVLQEKYGAVVPPKSRHIADKNIFRNSLVQDSLELEDMKRSRMISRVGTGVITVGGYLLGGVLGLSPLGIAVGIGGGIVSEIFMNQRVDAQKQKLSKLIQENIPSAFSACIQTVEQNIREVYLAAIEDMRKACEEWAKIQCDAIDTAQNQESGLQQEEALGRKLAEVKKIGS